MKVDAATPGGAGTPPGRLTVSSVGAITRPRTVSSDTIGCRRAGQPDYARIHTAALPWLESLCRRWLPDGRRIGSEWAARNPRRDDRRAGSMRVSLRTGRWADFALGDARGGDVVSLAAYLHGLSQPEAARRLARMLGVADGTR